MSRFVEGEDRRQPTLLPSCLDDYVGGDNPARVIDVFVEELDLGGLGFVVTTAAMGRPGVTVTVQLIRHRVMRDLGARWSSRQLSALSPKPKHCHQSRVTGRSPCAPWHMP
jgi:hypothetical protein